MSLKGKRILITAGPTWVSLDPVRVISNTASGETGKRLAYACAQAGARITLLLGPGEAPAPDKRICVRRFRFFEELDQSLRAELRKKYDAVVHSAAVSDYRPQRVSRAKISSRMKRWSCTFVPTPKLIAQIRTAAPESLTIGFKFEPEAAYPALIASAARLMRACRLDGVVANTVAGGRYKAYIVTPRAAPRPCSSKAELVKELTRMVSR